MRSVNFKKLLMSKKSSEVVLHMVDLPKRVTDLWAKKRSENGQQYWLPLIVHLIDAQNVMNWLYNHWLAPGQREFLETNLSEAESQKLIKFIGFVHDLGKATPSFQKKESHNGDHEIDHYLIEQLVRDGFDKLSELNLSSPNKSPHARAGEALLEKFGVPLSIGAIIGGHHGKPEKSVPKHQIRDYTANYWQADDCKKLQNNWQVVQQDLLEYGLQSSGYETIAEIPDVPQPIAVILEGLLIMADWLASTEYLNGVPLFPLIELDQSYQDIDLTKRYQNAINHWNISSIWTPEMVTEDDPYQTRWGFKARPVQKKMTEAIGVTIDPGMIIVEAGTGQGKTEIALVAAEQLAYQTGRNGVFMGLPTQATTNAMFDRVNNWLDMIAKAHHDAYSIKLLHGKAKFNQAYRNLPKATDIFEAEDNPDMNGSVTVNSWFSGKKSILTPFTVGTVDNLLLMGLKQKHLFLKHLGIGNKIVIIDEIHAYTAYMSSYIYKTVTWLGAYHVPIVILSATLPKNKRNKLMKAYLRGKYGPKFKRKMIATPGWDKAEDYPLLSIVDGPEIKQFTDFSGKSDRASMRVQIKRMSEEDTDTIQAVLAKILNGGVAGIIVNTIKRAQALAELVPVDVPMIILHSAFLAPDRAKQEQELQAVIGKNAKRPDKMIVIGTQVLEQSLDIDFDVLYTDIAPMDLILQRVGRLHRHNIERPKYLQEPQVYIMGINGPQDYGDANEAIYGKYLLMKTDHFLQSQAVIPDDISKLVQVVYDDKTDSEVDSIEAAKAEFDLALRKATDKAKVFQIDNPDWDEGVTIHNWLDRSQDGVSASEQRASAAVRDIKETIEVIMLQKKNQQNYLLDGRSLSMVSDEEIAQQLIRLPVAVTSNIDQAIITLEQLTSQSFSKWEDSVWLKGSLALVLEENATTKLGSWNLTYSNRFGLSYTKEDDYGE